MKDKKVEISSAKIDNEKYFKITNSDALRPFFMSIVSASNHWMFISSNGGLSAGRKNAEYAIFPYYTDDKITESAEITGSKTMFQVHLGRKIFVWEPFSVRGEGIYRVERNLYKHEYGNKIIFEEINIDLQLTFQYQWSSSNEFGFVKKSTLINKRGEELEITLLDGIQNVLPYGVGSDLQNQSSNLVDAYKRTELLPDSPLGIFALSAIIVDKAEPSEALKANVAWSTGILNPKYLLSSLQLDNFRENKLVHEEQDVKGEKGAYFVCAKLKVAADSTKDWMIITNVNQSQGDIIHLSERIKKEAHIQKAVEKDIASGTEKLRKLNAAADGLQLTADKLRDTRHFSNTLFNIMRGGIFDDNYIIEKWDFINYLKQANSAVFKINQPILDELPEKFTISQLEDVIENSKDANFKRLCTEYMPLKFSRRHGDPSRPWNKFSINTQSEVDGSKILDYEGNWRDIFQNWEALALSYPGFIESMIHKFLNASTFDGYNPYRVTKDGYDWETIEPDNPWSYIGYWGDHQIIYLLKFLEFIEKHYPGKLESLFDEDVFVYANVPYKIKGFYDILKNPKDTIEFDEKLDKKLRERKDKIGADGALLLNRVNQIHQVNFVEKILATLLAKLSNFIPEGGIWMNTQRPEWNDANNALVGNGVSMVTLYYLRRFLHYFQGLFASSERKNVPVSVETLQLFEKISEVFENHRTILSNKINDRDRRVILEGLGMAATDFRNNIYQHSFSNDKGNLALDHLQKFIGMVLEYVDHSISANKRSDNLYHAYNLMSVTKNGDITISYLSEMLEGQVAVLSSGYLSSAESLRVLDGLKASALFREDQYSYLLYPNKALPRFWEKNNIPAERVESSPLLSSLLEKNEKSIIEKDIKGHYHFNGNFKNAGDLAKALDNLSDSDFGSLIKKHKEEVLDTFEAVFNHKAFTGRSGTFYGYEGLGSIYWHMVSKLQLAVLECCIKAHEENESAEILGRLLAHYYEINEGIGVHKSPALYGAFPTDPYSHTPAGKGAQQPGMTGQVKEDILSRFGELGVFVEEGQILFDPFLLRKSEFLKTSESFEYFDLGDRNRSIQLEKGSIGFTYCQVPIIYILSDRDHLQVDFVTGTGFSNDALKLDKKVSNMIFNRTTEVEKVVVHLDKSKLK